MSRNIKIELELPEFEKELNISVTLRKDGEVIDTSLSTSEKNCKTEIPSEKPIWKQLEEMNQISENQGSGIQSKNNIGGNMMDISF